MSLLKKMCLFLAPLMLLTLLPMVLSAQDNMGNSMNQKVSVTGCLKQGSDTGGYYIMGDDGKMYELMGKNLGEHVNHKVTVTGMQEKMSSGQEGKRESTEKTEAGNATVVDLRVHSVKMVSENCQ